MRDIGELRHILPLLIPIRSAEPSERKSWMQPATGVCNCAATAPSLFRTTFTLSR